jgi:hypothetical protein
MASIVCLFCAITRPLSRNFRQPDAGPRGVAEQSVVPRKPGNAGRGKGPQFKVHVRRGESREIGDEPDTSTGGSEATGGVARPSEGIARLSVLHAVRQGVSSRRTGIRLPMLFGQRRSSRSGRPDVRGHREVRRGALARRTDGGTQEEDVSTAGRAAGGRLAPQSEVLPKKMPR